MLRPWQKCEIRLRTRSSAQRSRSIATSDLGFWNPPSRLACVERGLAVERQVAMPLIYKGVKLKLGYRPDLIINGAVIVELKSVDKLITQHQAQVLTYLKLSGLQTGLLINIQSQPLINGIKRLVTAVSA
jgi:GxxExxY protein